MKDFVTALNHAQEFKLERYVTGGGYYLFVGDELICSFAGRGQIQQLAQTLIEQAEHKLTLYELRESA